MSFLSEDKKDEIKWWIQDHKGKFYAICGGIVISIFAIIIIIASQFKEEPVIEAPTEDSYEELDVGGFDVDEQIQKDENEENTKQEKDYGLKFNFFLLENMEKFSYVKDYDYSFADILIGDSSSVYQLYVDETTIDSSVLSSDTYDLMIQHEDIFSLRCMLEDLPEETRLEWEKRDKRNVLDLFRDSKINKETATEWNTHLSELKVSKGFTEQDTVETIGEDKWNEIMDEMYTYFEEYLLGLDNSETGENGPLSAYLEENPYPKYDNVKIAKSSIYLCDIKARALDVFTKSNLEKYASLYWDTYYSDAEEIFLNEYEEVSYKTLKDGKFYKLKKQVTFTLDCSYPEEDIVVWYLEDDGYSYTQYIPKGSSVWEHQESGSYWDSSRFVIGENVQYFGYFIVDTTYKRNFTGTITFETTNNEGEIVVNKNDLVVEEKIKYTREGKLGDNITVNVSEFLMSDGPYEIPYGVYYVKNDTKEGVTLCTTDEYSNFSIEPGDEVYIDWSIKEFNWKVNR